MIQEIKTLRSWRARRIFIFSTTLFVVVLAIALYATVKLQPDTPGIFYEIVYSVLINLIAFTFTAIILFFILTSLLGEESQLANVEIVDPAHTKALHDQALTEADMWYHNGHFGRWVRIVAMPALARRATDRGITTTIKLCILNPNNAVLCKAYSDYRNRISFRDPLVTSPQEVHQEILATIVASHIYHNETSGLRIHVYLKDFLSLVREDMCNSFVFRTQINPRCSAVVYRNNGGACEHYNVALNDFSHTLLLSTDINLDTGIPNTDVGRSYVKDVLTTVGCLDSDDPRFIDGVVQRVQSAYHPYT